MTNPVDSVKWEELCQALLKERDQLRADLDKVRMERDAYKALYRLTEHEISYSKEEILSYIGKEPPLEMLIAEIEQDVERQV